jgi:hypothetical protein
MLHFCYNLLHFVTMLTISDLRHHYNIMSALCPQHTHDILTWASMGEQIVNLLINRQKKIWEVRKFADIHSDGRRHTFLRV